tara:strand:- start:362 stop:643 length:282 start_codon:yes stop_codon:yes gene_type:complete
MENVLKVDSCSFDINDCLLVILGALLISVGLFVGFKYQRIICIKPIHNIYNHIFHPICDEKEENDDEIINKELTEEYEKECYNENQDEDNKTK